VRLPVDLFNTEEDSMFIEPMEDATIFTKILSFCIDSVDVEFEFRVCSVSVGSRTAWTQVMGMETLCMSTESSPNEKKYVFERKYLRALLGLYRFDLCKKTDQKIPCKCAFNILYGQ
jgi:hypothetical protein